MEMATKELKPRANPATKASWGRRPVDGLCALAAEGEAQTAWAKVGGRAHQSVHLLRIMRQGCGDPLRRRGRKARVGFPGIKQTSS